MSWNGKYWGALKYSNGVLFFGFPWISCKNNVCTRESWFSHLETNYNLYVFFFSTLYFFHELEWQILRGPKIQQKVLIFGFPWISCKNNVCTRESWFSHLETIYNLYVFFFPTLYFLHELEWQIPGGPKIQQWGVVFWIPLD